MEKVRQEMTRSLGADTRVRRMGGETPLEICDVDELTDKEKVLAAMAQAADGSVPRLGSLRRTYRSAKITVVVLPTPMAKRLYAAGRIRVGLVYARVRQAELPSRCYRCLAFGHIARECTGPDRSGVCWRCGVAGHTVALTKTATMAATDSGKGPSFAFMQFPDLLVLNCYWKPGGPIQEFEEFLSGGDAVCS